MAYALENYLKKKKLAQQIAKEEKKLDNKFTTDIAPVGNQEEKSSWFNSATFDDGYQFGDVTKALLGTTADVSVDLVKGAGRMVEGLVDLGTYGVGAVGKWLGNDEFYEDAKKVAQYSAVDEWTKSATDGIAPYSLLGKKSDSVTEGLGQVAGLILSGGALGAAGVTSAAAQSAITMGGLGLSSMGGGMNEAYQSGASDGEAVAYGAIAGAAEVISEMIFGGLSKASKVVGIGKGILDVDDAIAKGVTSKIKSTLLKNTVQLGVKAGAEGVEEVLSGVIQAAGQKLTYAKEEDFGKLIEDQNLLESFVVGALTSGISQVGGMVSATKQGTDYVTGYTKNEQKVIDAEVAKIVEQRQKDGGKLSKKELGEIEEAVIADMEKGYISIDSIADTLGDSKHKSVIEQEAKLQEKKKSLENEIKTLLHKPNPTMADQETKVALSKELNNVKKQISALDTKTAKSQMSSEVFELLKSERNGKGSTLLSSYAEKARANEKFSVDIEKVAPEKKEIYQRAMDSGVWNNTNKAHDFVDLVATVENKTGIKFDFANDAKLAEMGYAVQGAKINGVRTKDSVILNANSSKSLEIVVGHEVTHTLEQTKNYAAFRESILDFAKSKGDYQARYDAIVSLYAKKNADGGVLRDKKGNMVAKDRVKDLDIDGEIVADLVGEYLFTNEEYIRKLATKRNVFQKIWDEIKYLVKMATTGSREQKELMRVEKTFEKMFKEIADGNHIFTSDSVKYNLAAVEEHRANLKNRAKQNPELGKLISKYDKIVEIWDRIGVNLDSTFLKEWNEKKGTDRAFEVFKKQQGYTYNIELSTMCKKGVPLFEAIDKIVTDEVMKDLKTDTIGKAEKEILYDILKSHHLDIPCAICYVEQARQREGNIIDKFLNGDGKSKLGWNQTLSMIEEKMAEKGVNYKFPFVDRSIATDKYTPANLTMDEKTQKAFYESLKEITNEEITKNNERVKKAKEKGNENTDDVEEKIRPLIKEVTPKNIKRSLGGKLSGNLFVLEVLFNNPASRFAIGQDILYSSKASLNLTKRHNVYLPDESRNITIRHERLYSLFNSQGGVGGYKTKQTPVVYWADILSKNWKASLQRLKGGIRNQSNSDFQMYTLLDQAQMYIDLTTKGYYLHAYTKVLSELKLFGKSNSKINASLIPKVEIIYKADGKTVDIEKTMENAGLDAYGELIFDDVEGIDHKEAFMLLKDAEYSKSIGGICIGYSDKHIAKLLDTPEVQLIIGFHDKTNNPAKRYKGAKYSKNYTGFNETKNSKNKNVHISFGEYLAKAESHFKDTGDGFVGTYTFNGKTYTANDIPKLAADIYLATCAEKGWSPMYSRGGMDFSTHENYYKLLADFSLYDSEGNYAPHRPVSYNMPDEVPYLDENGAKKYMKTEEYIEKELRAEMELRGTIAEKLADKSEDGIIPQFVKRVNELHTEDQFSLSGNSDAPQGKYTGLAYEGNQIAPTVSTTSSTTSSTELSTETETPTEDIAPTVDNSVDNVDAPEKIKLSEIQPDLKEIAPETPKVTETEIKPTTDEIAPQKSKIKADDSKMRIGVKDTIEKTETIIEKPSPDGHTQVVQTKPLDAPLAMDSVKSDYAKVSATDPTPKKNPQKGWFRTHFVDKGAIFEDLDIERKRKDRPLQSKFHKIARAEAMAQNLIGNGAEGVKSLQSIKDRAEAHKTSHEFQDYLYHLHNIDRMSLDTRFKTANKAVFGDDVTADVSRKVVAEYEAKYSWFKKDAEAVYNYNRHLRQLMVDKGLISAETAELWEQMYPHYVPITRTDHDGVNVNVPLYTNKTGVNAPVKRAVGGNGDINKLFNTMAERTEQVYRAIAKNEFGIELKNTLNSEIAEDTDTLDIDNIDNDELLQPSKNGKNPTFTVFENGKRVTFEITPEMYEAMRPSILPDSENVIAKTVRGVSKARRNLITQYNPFFAVRNAIKDAQDVWWNSQHAVKTYAKFPTAVKEILTKGRYYTEYLQNGGEAQKHYDNNKRSFDTETKLQKMSGVAFGWISKMSDFSEKIPRLAEYIASRENGASVDTAMLDSARVTTNFQAGGDITKWANRHGFTFLNAGVQGFLQNVRNVREAKMNGLKGGLALMGKLAVAGIPMILANAILWGDDEEYEELSDYVKDNYYIIGKFNDGTFVRLPKGRTTAVVQDAFEQIANTLTGNDEADWENFWKLFIDNLAPSNPLDNNLFAPIADVIDNETWYGEDLVPTRLQDLPKSEQYDESTDALSRWLGENIEGFSPYKFNYLLDQYTGVLGDVFLPMMTPESTSGAENPLEHLGAMATDNFTTDSTFNNQNVADFYDVLDELTANANSAYATDDDKLKYKYMDSVRTELSELYKSKRAIQGSDLGSKEKYDLVRNIQKQINDLAKNALLNYENIGYENGIANVGDKYFYNDDDSWKKLKDNPLMADIFDDYSVYNKHSTYLKSLTGDINARKKKATQYINSIDIDYGQKLILYRQLFPNDSKYNKKIVAYLSERKDISKEDKIAIIEELGMRIGKDGRVYWD